jgi:hypothetical protein
MLFFGLEDLSCLNNHGYGYSMIAQSEAYSKGALEVQNTSLF